MTLSLLIRAADAREAELERRAVGATEALALAAAGCVAIQSRPIGRTRYAPAPGAEAEAALTSAVASEETGPDLTDGAPSLAPRETSLELG